MAVRYHISDNGMPGKCSAASPESCPKTQAGDSFHGTLEEASGESQRRFEEKLGGFVTKSKADERVEQQTAIREKQNEAIRQVAKEDDEIYVHPQGKIITIDSRGYLSAFKDGRELGTSATPEKLRKGHGSWKRVDYPASTSSEPKKKPLKHLGELNRSEKELKEAWGNFAELNRKQIAYDKLNGAKEGRAYYINYGVPYGQPGWGEKVRGVDPKGRATRYDPTPEQREELQAAKDRRAAASAARDRAQTEMEEAGYGHYIPDSSPNHMGANGTIRVRNQAQKRLLEDELKGQISDGKWENSANTGWAQWTSAKVIVDPTNVGRNFRATKDNFQLNAKDLLDVVGDRMVENVREKTGRAAYDERQLNDDLKDLRSIFKTKR